MEWPYGRETTLYYIPVSYNVASYWRNVRVPIQVEASCGCPKYANDVYMNIHNPNPNPNPNPKSLTPP